MATTIEEAKRCPKCSEPGEMGPKRPGQLRGSQVATATCRNSRCRWYNTGWAIQFNPDGTIPDAMDHQDREPKRWPRPDNLLFNQRVAAAQRQADEALRASGG